MRRAVSHVAWIFEVAAEVGRRPSSANESTPMSKSKPKLAEHAAAARVVVNSPSKPVPSSWQPLDAGSALADLRLLVEHFDRLMARRAEIVATAAWRDIAVEGCECALGHMSATGPFSLGPLLETWAGGAMTCRGPGSTAGSRAYVYAVSGSPMTGAGGAYAFSPEDRTEQLVGRASDYAREAIALSRASGPASPWRLADLLVHWGLPVPAVEIRDDRALLARYDFASSSLLDAAGRTVERFDPHPLDMTWSPPAPPATGGGVAGFTLGRLGLRREQRHRATLRIHFSAPLPTRVAARVARWLVEGDATP